MLKNLHQSLIRPKQQINQKSKTTEKTTYLTDVALISVTNTEFNAVMHFHDWVSKTVEGDDQIYQFAQFHIL